MSQEKPYRLSFYESGYIKPEEFGERRQWEAEVERFRADFKEGFLGEKEKIEFYGCMGFITPKKNVN